MQKNDCSQPMYSNTMTMAGTSYTDSGTVKLIAVNEKKTQKKNSKLFKQHGCNAQ